MSDKSRKGADPNGTLTPVMQQYWQIKQQHPDCLLFFRLGDFYEMFFEDAKVASKELELVLTGRDCGQEERAPMCGVPYHSCEAYIARLIAKGYKVAICEQLEDPALAKGLVKRDVVRIITPGTVIEGSMLDEGRNNYLSAIYYDNDQAGVCFADWSTGQVHVTHITGEDVLLRVTNELARFSPREVLLSDGAADMPSLNEYIVDRLGVMPERVYPARFDYDDCEQRVLNHFRVEYLEDLGLENRFPAVRALGCVLHYLYETQKTGLQRLDHLNVYTDSQFMRLDLTTRRNLELTETLRGKEKRGSLLGVLDQTNTAMGKRLIRSYIEQPLLNPGQIIRRQEAVEELVGNTVLRGDLTELLSNIYDLERIMTRIVFGTANAKELRALAQTISYIQPVKERLEGVSSSLLKELQNDLDPLTDVFKLIDDTIVEDPPVSVREGGIIKPGYSPEIDELHYEMTDGKGIIARIEASEKEKTGIKTLKVGFNRVFGYYLEVSRSFADQVPDHYIRKQTLANAERFITQELKELEARVLGAKDRVMALEYQLFTEVRDAVAAELPRVQQTATAIARLDVLNSFAKVAVKRNYCRPDIDLKDTIEIQNGRHPVVEALLNVPFVPNDTLLDSREHQVALITGPNMAGKSTYMRQTALIVLMAQIGSFVPAEKARIGIVDGIFTRIGASDDLAAGQSTFMVEMSEVAAILKNATKNSLIIFDEIGRGTSTYDGMSIAKAVLEYVANRVGAKTMFATHYHELTRLEWDNPAIKNYNIAVKKRGDHITFLRRIVPGPADRSYGIEVAKLAGIPDAVVARAKEVLAHIEAEGSSLIQPAAPPAETNPNEQLSLLATEEYEIVKKLREIDVNTLTPIEAMQVLHLLSVEAKK